MHWHIRQLQAFDALTVREKAIASLLAYGQTHKQVANQLNRSPATVRNQIQTIYGKLQVDNVAALAQAIKLSE